MDAEWIQPHNRSNRSINSPPLCHLNASQFNFIWFAIRFSLRHQLAGFTNGSINEDWDWDWNWDWDWVYIEVRGWFYFISVLFWVVAFFWGVAPPFAEHFALGYNYVVNTSSSPSSSSTTTSAPTDTVCVFLARKRFGLQFDLIWFAPNWELVWIGKYFDVQRFKRSLCLDFGWVSLSSFFSIILLFQQLIDLALW